MKFSPLYTILITSALIPKTIDHLAHVHNGGTVEADKVSIKVA